MSAGIACSRTSPETNMLARPALIPSAQARRNVLTLVTPQPQIRRDLMARSACSARLPNVGADLILELAGCGNSSLNACVEP